MEFEFKGEVFVFDDLTVRQMELLSEMLAESRKALFSEITGQAETPQQMIGITISLSDVLQKIREKGLLARFCAICLTRKDQPWSEKQINDRTALFYGLPYKQAEAVFGFFFTGGSFGSLLMPVFLQSPAVLPNPKTRSGK